MQLKVQKVTNCYRGCISDQLAKEILFDIILYLPVHPVFIVFTKKRSYRMECMSWFWLEKQMQKPQSAVPIENLS